jgi:hypothetical protein
LRRTALAKESRPGTIRLPVRPMPGGNHFMRSIVKFVAAMATIAALAGCATPTPRQAFNAPAAGHIKTVVVTQRPNQDSYEAAVLGHPGMSFGLIGGLVAAADIQSKSNKLTQAIGASETKLQERMAQRLAAHLREAGYEVQIVEIPKDAKEDQALSVARKERRSDAVLLLEVRGAYWAAGPSTDYFPRVMVGVKTLDDTGRTLYEDSFTYGYAMANTQSVHLASDPKYRFKDIDTLIADAELTRNGLIEGVEAISIQIANDLKKP